MSQNKKLFITGVTGYIGGSVLTGLIALKKYNIVALVRSQAISPQLHAAGVKTVEGSLADLELLTTEAAKADVVIHTASADDLLAVQALVKGQKSRADSNAVFIQTSGTGELVNHEGKIEIPFDDEDIKRFIEIPDAAPHANVDHWLWENLDGLRAAIIAPSTIYGIGSGFGNKVSSQIPSVIKASVARGQAGWVGPRDDVVWSSVHIQDLVDLYLLVLDGLEKGTIEHGKAGGLYFGITQDYKYHDVAVALSKLLPKHGLIKDDTISAFPTDDLAFVGKYFIAPALLPIWNADSKGVANRSKKIGWRPSRPTLFETLEDEIVYLKDNKLFQ